ncbi:MAG: HAD-IB family hydrolase [Anaerolineales bacterium]|nr:HAD-IB family hydrolase [Anaerolineales bacterium]
MGNNKSGDIAAIFDLDGTLYTGHITLGLAEHHRTRRVKRFELYTYMLTHMPIWWLQRLGLVSEATSRSIWARNMGWTVRGWTPQEAKGAFQWLAEEYVLPRVRPQVMARLRGHQDAGNRVILVSGTFSPLLREIGHQLGVRETVGTPIIVKNGRYTGGSELPVCQGQDKVTRLKAYLGETADINWSKSFAYADSRSDIHLLEAVGFPIAVAPDPFLEAYAREREWEILH